MQIVRHPWVDSRHAPVYVIRFPENFDGGQVDELYAVLGEWWTRAQSAQVWIIDYGGCKQTSGWSERADAYRAYNEAVRPFTELYLAGRALVVPDPVMRLAIRGMFGAPAGSAGQVKPVPGELQLFEVFESALAWATALLARTQRQQRSRQS